MPLFTLVCIDKPGALATRMAAREDHLVWARERLDQIKMAGPFLDEAGAMVGSLFIIEAQDLAAAKAFADADPYGKAGLFDRVDINGFRTTLGHQF
ncbi:MAG: hypothetical protein JWQ46_1139 [Phenylobacterium sp.]|nr:hypothetical protein [Phenylobacterium sp.]